MAHNRLVISTGSNAVFTRLLNHHRDTALNRWRGSMNHSLNGPYARTRVFFLGAMFRVVNVLWVLSQLSNVAGVTGSEDGATLRRQQQQSGWCESVVDHGVFSLRSRFQVWGCCSCPTTRMVLAPPHDSACNSHLHYRTARRLHLRFRSVALGVHMMQPCSTRGFPCWIHTHDFVT